MHNVIASHSLGFADIAVEDLKSSEEIILQPWGRVEGVLKVGARPAANQTVRLQNFYWRFGGWPTLMIVRQTTTDADGRFVFEGVPPGERKVSSGPRLREGGMGASAFSHDQLVLVKPGEATFVTLGGAGRTVLGRVSVDGVSTRIDWQQDVHNLTLKVGIPPEAVMPVREDFATDKEYTVAISEYAERSRPFWLSEAGREAQRMQRTCVLLFEPDGSFRVNDVPPGTYELSVTPMEPPAPVKTAGGGMAFPTFGIRPIGLLKMEIVVPGVEEGTPDVPMNLGTLRLKPISP
jgi:hypothetical protein